MVHSPWIKMGEQLRLRVFAGPNGSGKTTIINSVRDLVINGRKVDFGMYINADDIAQDLRVAHFSFNRYSISGVSPKELIDSAVESGLLEKTDPDSSRPTFIEIVDDKVFCSLNEMIEPLAQLIADFLRRKLLAARIKFSFETVFSHSSKVDFMRESSQAGYKVYLYFVGTESPEINQFRVRSRVAKGGHNVPEDKILSRYDRSMNLLMAAAQCCYQAFFFDNSNDGEQFSLFAHFKLIDGKKVWDPIDWDKVPQWFHKYYANKI